MSGALAVVAVVLAVGLAGCTPEKALALRTAAVQFRIEALAAIEAIDEMRRREIAPPPRSTTEATEEFVQSVLEMDPATLLTPKDLDVFVDPFTVRDGPTGRQWQEFLAGLRAQYTAFAAIFDDVEGGSYLARDAVKRAGAHAEKLTAQMAALARSIAEHPPQLLQYRAALAVRIDQTRKDARLADADRRRRLAELKDEWEAVSRAQEQLGRVTVEQCLKAAILGRGVHQLIATYDRLSLDDINTIAAGLLDTAGALSGRDLGSLRVRTNTVVDQIKQDPVLTRAFDQVAAEVGALVGSRF